MHEGTIHSVLPQSQTIQKVGRTLPTTRQITPWNLLAESLEKSWITAYRDIDEHFVYLCKGYAIVYDLSLLSGRLMNAG